MDVVEELTAARAYVGVALGDRDKGFFLSACLTAQKAAEVALQAYLRGRGMSGSGDSLPMLLAAVPGRSADLEAAARVLERFRMDMFSPYRSAPELGEPTVEAAAACCLAAEAIVAHVEGLFREDDLSAARAARGAPGGRP